MALRPRAKFKMSEVSRLARAARDIGLELDCIEVAPDGTLRMIPAKVPKEQEPANAVR